MNMVLCDGRFLRAYADRFVSDGLHLAEILPPYHGVAFGDADVRIDLTRRGSKPQKGCGVSSSPLARQGGAPPLSWGQLGGGEILLLRPGAGGGGLVTGEAGGARPVR